MNYHFKKISIPVVIASFILFFGWSSNPPDGNTGAPFDGLCSGCHSGGSYDGTISISGLPSTIAPNTTYPITLTMMATTGSPVVGGFQLVAVNAANQNIGDLIAGSGSGTSFFNSREYVDHRGPKAFSGGSVSWTFDWTSPNGPNGTVVNMYFSGNMANGNGNSSGDKILNDNASGTIMGGGVPLTVNIVSKKNVSCFGGDDGEATASAGGGNPPYDYNWSNGQTGNKATMLTAGTYRVTVTDNSGTTATASTIITQPNQLLHNLAIVRNVSCPGGKDGSILATASGGTPPYNFVYSSGSPNNLIAGIYSVTVSDANNCTVSSSVVVTEPDSFSINKVIFDNPSCPLDSNGQVSISVMGANPPYKYLWSTGEIINQIANKKVGNYKVTITDNKNCNVVRGYELTSVDNLPPNLIAKNAKVYLNNLGYTTPVISDYITENKDNCDPKPILKINIDTFRCNALGKMNYIISSTDVSGNTARDTIQIEVLDTIQPSIHVWQDTLFKRCDVQVPLIMATDNCKIVEFKKESGPDVGTIFPPGETTLIYSAKDDSGNQSVDSFKTLIMSPIQLTIDSTHFNNCLGDTLFTDISLSHAFDTALYFYHEKDTIKILADTSFSIFTTQHDTTLFSVLEESGCLLEYESGIHYPGPALRFDSVNLIHQSDPNIPDGKIEIYLSGGVDSLAIYDFLVDTLVNNSGIQLRAGQYLVKAYKGFCEFIYGPYEIKLILSNDNHISELVLSAYPVPFNDKLTIISSSNSEQEFILYNSNGNIIERGAFHRQLEFKANHLKPGLYFLRSTWAKQSETLRLIKL